MKGCIHPEISGVFRSQETVTSSMVVNELSRSVLVFVISYVVQCSDHSHKVTAQLDAGVDTEAEIVAGIEAHNFLRSLHGVQNLTRNETLDHEAQQRFLTYL